MVLESFGPDVFLILAHTTVPKEKCPISETALVLESIFEKAS
jgi:hypothetical protein